MALSLQNKTFSHILFTVILVLGIALSVVVFLTSYYTDQKLIRQHFAEAAGKRFFALERESNSNMDVLSSLQALYYHSINGSDFVKRTEFSNFTTYILKQHEDILSLAWIPRVPDSLRDEYESAARREGFPDFQFTERDASGEMKGAEKRKEYFPIYFVEPYKGNEMAFGYDFASESIRLEAMETARKSGEMHTTARITLVQETKKHLGFIVFAPVYLKGALINSDQARWDRLEGFVAGVFRIGDIVDKAMEYIEPEGVDFFIYDNLTPGEDRLLYMHESRTRKKPLLKKYQLETRLRLTKTLEVSGRKWLIIYSATPEYIAARRSWYPWGFLLAGLALTGLGAGYIFSSARHTAHVEDFLKDLSDTNANLLQEIMERKRAEEDLQSLTLRYKAILAAVPDIIIEVDNNKLYTWANKAGYEFFGDDVIGKEASFYFEGEQRTYNTVQPSFNGSDEVIYVESWQRRKDGAKRLLAWWCRALKNSDKNVRGVLSTARDITERKRADEMIAQLSRRNELILKSAGEGIYGIDLNGNTTFINPSATKMTGWEAEELIGKRQHEILHHSKLDGTPYPYEDCPIHATLNDGAVHHIADEVYWKKDGTCFPVEYTSTPIEEDGQLAGAVVVFRDITKRGLAEKTIKKNLQIQNILNSLLQVSLEGILLKELLAKALDIILSVPFLSLMPKGGIFVVEGEPEALILTVNRGFNVSIQEICARVPFGRCLCGQAAASKQIQYADCIDEHHENRYDGMINHGHYNIPILSMGKVLGVLVLYLEEGHPQEKSELEFLRAVADTLAGIIERKQLENALLKFNDELKEKVKERTAELETANSELKKLFNAIEQSDESIVITDINGDIQYVNPAFTRKTGYSREEAKGKNPRILKSGQTSIPVFNELWKTILSGIPWKGTLINRKKSGEIFYEDATIAPVFDELGEITHFVAAKTDVTDRIMAEEELKIKNTELKLAKETAESANRAKSNFLANMSHELRTPLNSIIGFSEILEGGIAGPIADNQKELLNDISSSGKHLLSLINDILDLSKVEAGKMKLELSEFNIEDLIDGSLVMFKEKAMKQNIKIVADVEEGMGEIEADERKIKQIMFNLLSNALKFTLDGGSVRVAARRISSAMGAFLVPALSHAGHPQEMPPPERDFVEISITDTGIGISPENQKKLFQPFLQIDSALSRKYSGTGLGLNLCKQFVELHGGRIWIESEEGRGSKFVFVISSRANPSSVKIVDPVTKLLTWEHVMMHLGRILSFHKRKGRRLGLMQMEVFSEKPVDYAVLAEILKKTIRKHEVLGHGARHGWYYVLLFEIDRQMVDDAVMRIKKVLADNGYSATTTTVMYPDDGENIEELLKALEAKNEQKSSYS